MDNKRSLKDTRITVPEDLYDKVMQAVNNGKFPGVRNFSTVIEFALVKLMEANKEEKEK